MLVVSIPSLVGAGTLGVLASIEQQPGASTVIGAIALLVTAAATAYTTIRRTQRQTRATVERNTSTIDDELRPKVTELERESVRRAEMEGWRELITFARDQMREAQKEVGQAREKAAADLARAEERYSQMQVQYEACEQGRIAITGAMERLRGEFEQFRRTHGDGDDTTQVPSR